jgi:hypothetical protein
MVTANIGAYRENYTALEEATASFPIPGPLRCWPTRLATYVMRPAGRGP